MTTRQKREQNAWRSMFRRNSCKETLASYASAKEVPQGGAPGVEAPKIEMASNDPIFAYFISIYPDERSAMAKALVS